MKIHFLACGILLGIAALNPFNVSAATTTTVTADRGIVIGKVTEINGTDITMETAQGKVINVDASDARVLKRRTSSTTPQVALTLEDIKKGSTVTAVGKLDDATIEANTIVVGEIVRPPVNRNDNAASDAKKGFFARIGLFFKGLFGKN